MSDWDELLCGLHTELCHEHLALITDLFLSATNF
jgi:hypothetical protein